MNTRTSKSQQTSKTKSKSTQSKSQQLDKMEKLKYEVADEIGVPLKAGYNGDLTSAQNGSVGGQMVKKMIDAQKKQMK